MRYHLLRISMFRDYGGDLTHFFDTKGELRFVVPTHRIKVRKLFRFKYLYVLVKEEVP